LPLLINTVFSIAHGVWGNGLLNTATGLMSEDGTYAILSPTQGAGYVKLFDNGNYIFRFYPKNQEGLMSLGKCE